MSHFTDSITAALKTLDTVAGDEVVYRRGGDWVRLVAVRGSTRRSSTDGYGVTVEHRSVDFLFSADDLVLNGAKTTPQVGDEIDVRRGLETHIHEVRREDGSEAVWRYSDGGHSRIRVFTRVLSGVVR